MKLALFLYLTDFFGNLSIMSFLLPLVYFIAITILFFGVVLTCDSYSKCENNLIQIVLKKFVSKWWIVVLAIIICIGVPAQRTMYLILGSIYLSESNLPAKVSQALELKLDDIIKEMKSDNQKEEKILIIK